MGKFIEKIDCPICRGTGTLEKPKCLRKIYKIEIDPVFIAQSLLDKEFSYREIARIMGYNNPQSIKHILGLSKK